MGGPESEEEDSELEDQLERITKEEERRRRIKKGQAARASARALDKGKAVEVIDLQEEEEVNDPGGGIKVLSDQDGTCMLGRASLGGGK